MSSTMPRRDSSGYTLKDKMSNFKKGLLGNRPLPPTPISPNNCKFHQYVCLVFVFLIFLVNISSAINERGMLVNEKRS